MVKIVYEPPSLADWVDTKLACLDRLLVTIERLLEGVVKDLDEYVVAMMQDEYVVAALQDEAATIGEALGYYPGLPDIRQDFEEEYWDLEKIFPDILRKSFFVTVYSFIEVVLEAICHREKHEGSLPLSLGDLKGDGIGRSKVYLAKVVCLSGLPFDGAEWNEIYSYYRVLRNCIVHDDSRLFKDMRPEEAERFEGYIRRTSGLERLGRDRVVFRKGFCEEVLRTTRGFFDQLFKVHP